MVNKARILLLSPTAKKFISDVKEFAPPIGLTWIAASLRKRGHKVKIIDCVAEALHNEKIEKRGKEVLIRYGLSDSEIERRIKRFNPDVVGISNIFTAQAGEALRLCKLVKEIISGIPVVIGGPHSSMTYKAILRKYPEVDYIIVKEGEVAMSELVDYLISKIKNPKKLRKIHGLAYREKGKIKFNESSFIMDLNGLPLPAVDLLNLKLYNRRVSEYYCYGKSKRKLWQSLSFGRGCPYNCDFCLASIMEGRVVRSLNLKNIEKILKLLKRKGITDITIEDNNFLRHKKFNEIIALFKKHGFVYNLINGVDPTILDFKIIDKLKRAGCYRVFYPLESKNPKVLKEAHKYSGLKVKRYQDIIRNNKKNIKRLTDLGIEVAAAYMIGFPYETMADIKRTGKFAVEIFKINPKMISTYVFCVTPFPGARLYENCRKNRLFIKQRVDWEINPEFYTYDHAQIGADERFLKKIEKERIKIMYAANRPEIAEFLVGRKSWKIST